MFIISWLLSHSQVSLWGCLVTSTSIVHIKDKLIINSYWRIRMLESTMPMHILKLQCDPDHRIIISTCWGMCVILCKRHTCLRDIPHDMCKWCSNCCVIYSYFLDWYVGACKNAFRTQCRSKYQVKFFDLLFHYFQIDCWLLRTHGLFNTQALQKLKFNKRSM